MYAHYQNNLLIWEAVKNSGKLSFNIRQLWVYIYLLLTQIIGTSLNLSELLYPCLTYISLTITTNAFYHHHKSTFYARLRLLQDPFPSPQHQTQCLVQKRCLIIIYVMNKWLNCLWSIYTVGSLAESSHGCPSKQNIPLAIIHKSSSNSSRA